MEGLGASRPWIDDHHEYGENEHEEPKVNEEEFAAPVDDLDDGRDERKHNNLPHDELLDLFQEIFVHSYNYFKVQSNPLNGSPNRG